MIDVVNREYGLKSTERESEHEEISLKLNTGKKCTFLNQYAVLENIFQP